MADAPLANPGVRFPPPLLFVGPFFVAFLLNRYSLPFFIVGDDDAPVWMQIGGQVMVVAGLGLTFWSLWNFFRARTNPLPHHAARTLVIVAPYTFTRNPMYLGLTCAYLGGALVTNWAWPLVFLPLSLLALRFHVIAREERYLLSAFGAPYEAYCARVRRWL